MDQAKRTRSSKASQEQKSISAGGALAFDTVNLLINTFSSLIRKERSMFKVERKGKGMREPVRCGDLSDGEKPRAWELGPRILQEIKNTSFVGLTGDWVLHHHTPLPGQIAFDEHGRRWNFTMDVMEMTVGAEMVQVSAGALSDLLLGGSLE